MSLAVAIKTPKETAAHAADSLANSILMVGVLMVSQRIIGFGRSSFVCRMLSPAEVGQWDLSFGFLTLAAPFIVLGIPGCFGRYIAQFQVRNESTRFLRRAALICACLTTAGAGLLYLLRAQVATVVFGDPTYLDAVALLAIGVPAVICFNFLTCWFSGLRLNRLTVRLQFAQTLLFAALCIFLLMSSTRSAQSVVIAYVVSCLMVFLLGCSYLKGTVVQQEPMTRSGYDVTWAKLVSFALWIWLSNLLINLFSICDRLLIVNYASSSIAESQSLVGQYHSSCILPLLLVGIGGMAGSVITPYLSHDWETSRHGEAHAKLNLMLKTMAIFCYVFSLGVLLLAPLFFSGIWKDKFASGEAMLPLTLTYCTWAALTLVAQKYFWCIERTWLSSCALAIGLTVNVALGFALLPSWGVYGVVVATLVAHMTVLATIYWFCIRWGMPLQKGVVALSLLPVLLCLGTLASAAGFAAIVVFTLTGECIFRDSEKSMLYARLARHLDSLLTLVGRFLPIPNSALRRRS